MGIIETLGELIGPDRVFDDPETISNYSQDESLVAQVRPRCIVRPTSMEEVQKIVQFANKTNTPLIPISSGAPHFRGDTIPSVGGAVIVDLSRLSRIIRIDSKNKVAMIEPGVTFGQLKRALKAEGLAPYSPLIPRPTKSVLTSYLEREPITIPKAQWDNQDPLLCVEVVYGSGDLFRTGSAAGPGTPEEQWKMGRAMMRGNGPTHTDFTKLIMAAQGTMGIVTWATVKCRRLPISSRTFLVASNDLIPVLDFVYRLSWRRIGDQILILNNQNLATILTDNPKEIRRFRLMLPTWMLVCTIYGTGIMPGERIAWQEKIFKRLAAQFELKPRRRIGKLQADNVAEVLTETSMEDFWKTRYKGGGHELFFLTTLDQTPKFVTQMSRLAKQFKFPGKEIGVYLQPMIHGANCHCEFHIPYNPKSEDDSNRVKTFDRDASKTFANSGGFFSRPYGGWADVAYGRDPATVRALRKVNSIFDPNKIMNPGKLCF